MKSAVVLCLAFVLLSTASSRASPEYAEDTGQGCRTCHVDEEEGRLSSRGLEYAASGYVWPPRGGYRILGPAGKTARLAFGICHILAAFMWFGTILYVHLMLRPGYASHGLPRGEAALGLISMAVVGVTGVFLTFSKIRGVEVLLTGSWGISLSVKIALYVIMVISAMTVVFFVGPKLKRGSTRTGSVKPKVFDPETLSRFDGEEGKPALIAFKGKVYDVTGLPLWRHGSHMKHSSGQDLSEALARAPHGEEKLEPLSVVGKFDAAGKPPRTSAQRAFYFVAYMNLALVFLVIAVIAYQKWGL